MDKTHHIFISVLLSFIIIGLGATGYIFIEGWNVLDALYMTIITVATVGYREVQPMGTVGKIFTMFLVVFGVGVTYYVAMSVVQFMVEGRIRSILGRRRLDKKIQHMKNHYIVCGYGRIGRVLCRKLSRKPFPLVVVERSADAVETMESDGVLYVSGEATEEATLILAGIHSARGLVAVLATDTDNVFLTLTARQLNPDLFIMARASQEESKSKLKAAGANQVESPYDLGAVRMAHRIIRPTVTSFLDLAFLQSREDIQMEEIPVNAASKLANVMLVDSGIRQQFNLIIIAVKKPDGNMLFNPSFETTIEGGDTLIAVGEGNKLQQLEKILNP